VALRWPSPGYHDQLGYRLDEDGEARPHHGVRWAVEVDGAVSWLDGRDWRARTAYAGPASSVIVTTWTYKRPGVRAVQRVSVAPETPVVEFALRLEGFEAPPRVFWYANLAPCARKLKNAPIADWLLDGRNDFAVVPLGSQGEGRRFVQFRPQNTGRMAWRQARKLAREGNRSAKAWAGFGPGAWIAAASRPAPVKAMCGAAGPGNAVLRAVERGELAGAAPRVAAPGGGVCFALEVAPAARGEGAHEAAVTLAFGEELKTALGAIEQAPATGGGVEARSVAADAAWLARARLPQALPPEAVPLCRRALLTLRTNLDADTGGLVYQPSTEPPLALDWPRQGAFPTLALLRTGYALEALTRFEFYADALAPSGEPAYPAFLPEVAYADGVTAAPRFLMSADATAWWLWACLAAAEEMPAPARGPFLARHADVLQAAGESFAQWLEPATARLDHAWDPALMRSARSARNAVAHGAGLTSAARLAEMAGAEVPDVRRAAELLERRLARDGGGMLNGIPYASHAPPWPRPLTEELAAALDERAARALGQLDGMAAPEAWDVLARLAWRWRAEPEKLARLRPRFLRLCAGLDASAGAWPSTLAGHIAYAAAVLYEPQS
jgi:hypothetical protein